MEPTYNTADIAERLNIHIRTAQELCNSVIRNKTPRARRKFTTADLELITEYHRRFGRKHEAKII